MEAQKVKSWWSDIWHQPVRAETLAMLRILFACVLLTDQLFQYLPQLAYLFGPEGVAPAGINDGYQLRNWKWPMMFFNTDNMTVIYLLFGTWVAATISMALGWKTRLSTFLVWLGAFFFITRNPNIKNGGDDVLQVALFFLLIAPCGAALSLDRLREIKKFPQVKSSDPVYIRPWAIRLFQLQMCMLYMTTGIAKLRGETWWTGTSIHNVLNDITMARWSYAEFPQPLWLTAPLTWISVWWETLFPLLVFWKKTRKWTLYFGLVFHIGIFVMIEVGWFSFYTMALYACWISSDWWDDSFYPSLKKVEGFFSPSLAKQSSKESE